MQAICIVYSQSATASYNSLDAIGVKKTTTCKVHFLGLRPHLSKRHKSAMDTQLHPSKRRLRSPCSTKSSASRGSQHPHAFSKFPSNLAFSYSARSSPAELSTSRSSTLAPSFFLQLAPLVRSASTGNRNPSRSSLYSSWATEFLPKQRDLFIVTLFLTATVKISLYLLK